MRTGEENIVVPLDSPERPPAMSYAAVRSSFPACLSIAWDPRVSRRSQAGASVGRAILGRACVRLRMRCGPPDLFGPAQQ